MSKEPIESLKHLRRLRNFDSMLFSLLCNGVKVTLYQTQIRLEYHQFRVVEVHLNPNLYTFEIALRAAIYRLIDAVEVHNELL